MTATVFIDGEAGTTGLQIGEKLAALEGVALRSLPAHARKDAEAKRQLLAEVDVAILCLPDAAARETVALVEGMGATAPRLIDASTAHRVANGWTYGFPELARGQAAAIAKARLVANQAALRRGRSPCCVRSSTPACCLPTIPSRSTPSAAIRAAGRRYRGL